jgi:hypothetical protein
MKERTMSDATTTADEAAAKKRANSVYTHSSINGVQVFDFGTLGRLTFDAEKVSAVNRTRAMTFGFKQRIVDAAALKANQTTGTTSAADKMAEMKRVIEHLESGGDEWNMKARADGGTDSGLVVQAVMRHFGWTVDEANANIATMGERDAVVKSLAKDPAIIRLMADIRAERAPKPADSMMARLMALRAPQDPV